MEREEAIQVIKQVCSAYKGTLQEHQTIQTAINVIDVKEEIVKDDTVGETDNSPKPKEVKKKWTIILKLVTDTIKLKQKLN